MPGETSMTFATYGKYPENLYCARIAFPGPEGIHFSKNSLMANRGNLLLPFKPHTAYAPGELLTAEAKPKK